MPEHTKEDQEILEEAMNYAYLIVTGKATFDRNRKRSYATL